MGLLSDGRKRKKSATSSSAPQAPAQIQRRSQKTRLIDTPVRSGQRIYAPQCDLIVTSHVSAGAELIADGNIHVYGMMRGRALAGASGDRETQIFCTNLMAELVSIAGEYWLSDQIRQILWQKSGARLQLVENSDRSTVKLILFNKNFYGAHYCCYFEARVLVKTTSSAAIATGLAQKGKENCRDRF